MVGGKQSMLFVSHLIICGGIIMLRQIKNEFVVEFPLFSSSNESIPLNSTFRKVFKDYFYLHKNTTLKIFSKKQCIDLFIDVFSLKNIVNVDCLHCPYSCCVGGHRFPTSPEFKTFFYDRLSKIVDSAPSSFKDQFVEILKHNNLFTPHPWAPNLLDIKKINNRCVFSFLDEQGLNKCIIHKYCLDNNLSINLIKPGSCSLFPIDFVRFKTFEENGYYLFACTRETLFSRFSIVEKHAKNNICPCLDVSCANELNFDENSYIPAYVYADSFVKEFFDIDLISVVQNSDILKNV